MREYDDIVKTKIADIGFYATLFCHENLYWSEEIASVFMEMVGGGVMFVGHIMRYPKTEEWVPVDHRYYGPVTNYSIVGAIRSLVHYEKQYRNRDLVKVAHGLKGT